MARGSIHDPLPPTAVSGINPYINFDRGVVEASWLLGVDDCHHCILVLHSVILSFWTMGFGSGIAFRTVLDVLGHYGISAGLGWVLRIVISFSMSIRQENA